MNARLAKLALTLCSLSLLASSNPLHAQDTNDSQVSQPPGYANGRRGPGNGGSSESTYDLPTFDIQIENQELSLAPLAGHPELTNFWATGTKTVPATMENISRYLRATDPHLSVILSPGTSTVMISDLKIKTAMLPQISDAISIASGNIVNGNDGLRGRGFFGGNGRQQTGDSTITFTSRNWESRPTMEVFNLSGYIQTLGTVDDKVVRQKIDELQEMTQSTLVDLRMTSSTDVPEFKFHAGTKLLIVVGKPEAIGVVRKIVNALAGQQTNGKADLLAPMPPSGQN